MESLDDALFNLAEVQRLTYCPGAKPIAGVIKSALTAVSSLTWRLPPKP